MTDADQLASQFDQIKAAEADVPTTKQVEEYTTAYDSLAVEARNKIAAYRVILTKIKHRKTYLKTKSKILKLAIEPGHVILTGGGYYGCGDRATEWFHVDQIRGKKGYVFRGRLLSIVHESPDLTLFDVQSTTMRATEAAGWCWHTPKSVSSVLGELVSSGINLMYLLDATTNIEVGQRMLFAFNKEKGWVVVPDQIIKYKVFTIKEGFRPVDTQLYTLDQYVVFQEFKQIKIEWPK
jgi:hypothetical protein